MYISYFRCCVNIKPNTQIWLANFMLRHFYSCWHNSKLLPCRTFRFPTSPYLLLLLDQLLMYRQLPWFTNFGAENMHPLTNMWQQNCITSANAHTHTCAKSAICPENPFELRSQLYIFVSEVQWLHVIVR